MDQSLVNQMEQTPELEDKQDSILEEPFVYINTENESSAVELNGHENSTNNTVSCDVCDESDVDYCAQCGKLKYYAIKENSVPMGSTRRAAQTIPQNILELRLSSIHGFGVFAKVPLSKGVQLGPYEGDLECSAGKSLRGYQWRLKSGRLVDSGDEANSNYLRFLNCTVDQAKQNIEAYQYRGQLLYRICRNIKPNEELLTYYGQMSDHLEGHFEPVVELSQEEFYFCEFCHVGTNFRRNRDKHQNLCKYQPKQRNSGSVEVVQCKHCQRVVTSLKVLSIHEKKCRKRRRNKLTEPGHKKFVCDSCNFTTNWPASFREHKNSVHDRKKLLKCPDCDYETYRITGLHSHIRIHRNVRDFTCEACGKGFLRKQNLDAHILSRHPELSHEITSAIYRGPGCSYMAVRKLAMTRHVLEKHPKDDTISYNCEQCKFKTYYKWNLISHMNTHTRAKQWHCSVCEMIFIRKHSLDTHILMAHPEDEHLLESITSTIHNCTLCEFRCVNKAVLERHIRKHQS